MLALRVALQLLAAHGQRLEQPAYRDRRSSLQSSVSTDSDVEG